MIDRVGIADIAAAPSLAELTVGTLIVGGPGNDVLIGTGDDDTLIGVAGDDALDGGAGKDLMIGGSGSDAYFVDDAGDKIAEQAGADSGSDTVTASVTYTLSANVETLFLLGDSDLNGTGNAQANFIFGNGGANKLIGLAENDQLFGRTGNDTLDGGNDNDTLSGGNDNDFLLGGAGDDTLDGGSGADTIAGGAGNDQYRVFDDGDQVIEAAGHGSDTIVTTFTNFTFDTKALANVENLVFIGGSAIGTGNSLNNVILGHVGNDTLNGGLGNDTLNGFGGASNELRGGKGNDVYIVSFAGDAIVENKNEGLDMVQSNLVTTDLGAMGDVENLILLSNAFNGIGNGLANAVTGSDFSNQLLGLAGNDTLSGGAGFDTLIGGADKDLMVGGTSSDTYIVDNSGDRIVELADADSGIDTVNATVSYALSANIEILLLSGAGDINGAGNAQNNSILGNSGANKLLGLAGNDFIFGEAGNDTLDGGAGSDFLEGGSGDDSMAGGAGNDTLDGESGADRMAGGTGNDQYNVFFDDGDQVIEAAGQGTDTIVTNLANFTLDSKALANVENLSFSGGGDSVGTGNSLNNQILGADGNDTLNGGLGNDTLDGRGGAANLLQGGKGNDVYIIRFAGDSVFENANEGIDTVRSDVITADLGDMGDVENLILLDNAFNGIGNGLANAITGNDFNNQLFGLAGNDTLSGGAGNDTLTGGAGKDLMIGGAGSDAYIVDDSGDKIVELAGTDSGTDFVNATVSYVLSANIEILLLSGASDIDGTGNAQNNNLLGNGGANKLFGLDGDDGLQGFGGDDTLDGGAGNDALFGDVGDDKLLGGTGNDFVQGGLGNDIIVGGAGNDTLNGEPGADSIDGGAGNDMLIGRREDPLIGDDTLTGGTGQDVFVIVNSDGAGIFSPLITDFAAGRQGDTLDLSDLLTGFVSGTSNVNDFVRIFNDSGSTIVQFDADGAANGANFVDACLLLNTTLTTDVNQAVADGNLLLA